MKVFITGAGGFLGKYIINSLNRTGHHTIYATSLYAKDLGDLVHSVIFVPNEAVLEFDFSAVDVVVNCAFPRAADGAGYANGLDYLNGLFRKIQPHTGCGIIDISSQSIYSFKRENPANEETPKVLDAVYSVSKYCMEMLVDARCEGHKIVHLRLASLIGPRFNQRIINRFINKVIAGEDIVVNGGNQLFGFLDVRDCADAVSTVVEQWNRLACTTHIYNVGAEESNSLMTIAETAVRIGREYGFDRSHVTVAASDEWINTSLDASRFFADFGWKPKYKLEDTARSIYEASIK